MPKVKKRTPTGKHFILVKRNKPKFAKCAICKKPLHGMPRLHAVEVSKLTKSNRRPERAYGGYLCSSCSRELFRKKARNV